MKAASTLRAPATMPIAGRCPCSSSTSTAAASLPRPLHRNHQHRSTTLVPPRATLTTFAITPPGGGDSDSDEDDDSVVECPTIRASLQPRPSPFVLTNYYGGGFASDDDRVALSSIRYASPSSANASCQGFYAAPSSSLVEEQKKKKKTASSSGSSSSSSTTRGEIGGDGLFESGHDAVCIPLPPWAIRAGARETVYFDGRKVTVRERERDELLMFRERKRRRRNEKKNSTSTSSTFKNVQRNFSPPISGRHRHVRRALPGPQRCRPVPDAEARRRLRRQEHRRRALRPERFL